MLSEPQRHLAKQKFILPFIPSSTRRFWCYGFASHHTRLTLTFDPGFLVLRTVESRRQPCITSYFSRTIFLLLFDIFPLTLVVDLNTQLDFVPERAGHIIMHKALCFLSSLPKYPPYRLKVAFFLLICFVSAGTGRSGAALATERERLSFVRRGRDLVCHNFISILTFQAIVVC